MCRKLNKAHGIVIFVWVSSKFEPANEDYDVEWYLGVVVEYNLEKV